MFVTATADNNIIPASHRKEVFQIYQNIPYLRKLQKECDPIIAGGYALALFAAPRIKIGFGNTGIIPDYYSDIDLYARDKEHEELIKKTIENSWFGKKCILKETDRATTYSYKRELYLQVIKSEIASGTPEEILSKFDLINCSIAIEPGHDRITFHKDLPTCHVGKEVRLQNYKDLFSPHDENNITALMRIVKYCIRWNFTIDELLLRQILYLVSNKPILVTKPEHKYGFDSSGLTSPDETINIWSLVIPIAKRSPAFNKLKQEIFTEKEFIEETRRLMFDKDSHESKSSIKSIRWFETEWHPVDLPF